LAGLLDYLIRYGLNDASQRNEASAIRSQSITDNNLDLIKELGRASIEHGYKLEDPNENLSSYGVPLDAINGVAGQAFQRVGVGPEVERFSTAGMNTPEDILGSLSYGDLNRSKGGAGEDYTQAILSKIAQTQANTPGNIPFLGANPDVGADTFGNMTSNPQGFLDALISGNADYDAREYGQQAGLENLKHGNMVNRINLEHGNILDRMRVKEEMSAGSGQEVNTNTVIESILDPVASIRANARKTFNEQYQMMKMTNPDQEPVMPDTSDAEKRAMEESYRLTKLMYGDSPGVDWNKVDRLMEMRGISTRPQSANIATPESVDRMLREARRRAKESGETPPTRTDIVKRLQDRGWVIQENTSDMSG